MSIRPRRTGPEPRRVENPHATRAVTKINPHGDGLIRLHLVGKPATPILIQVHGLLRQAIISDRQTSQTGRQADRHTGTQADITDRQTTLTHTHNSHTHTSHAHISDTHANMHHHPFFASPNDTSLPSTRWRALCSNCHTRPYEKSFHSFIPPPLRAIHYWSARQAAQRLRSAACRPS